MEATLFPFVFFTMLTVVLAVVLLLRQASKDRQRTSARPANGNVRAVLHRLRKQSVQVGRI